MRSIRDSKFNFARKVNDKNLSPVIQRVNNCYTIQRTNHYPLDKGIDLGTLIQLIVIYPTFEQKRSGKYLETIDVAFFKSI